ncbi:hypothetical protein [Dyella nitratireducens]|uniref:Outer membrane protein beta-barrel domain-containing protein n=1 Tax=Dyella nitratireducens TaxID=1849580 RepID=A0ABQ1G5J0_9GAMM|nr:hypothetical protein [Dyella nitratireducens]GGA37383.1 hypothetical protein GCM10010981_28160 [Dyella nitratireducens]GLQ41194.1 hypothetical protein GCM10007902_10440 [Dyella nitratireducens]
MRQHRSSVIAILILSASTSASTLAENSNNQPPDANSIHVELVATGAYTILKGRAETYDFFSVSPELRVRFGQSSGQGWFLGLGAQGLSNLNENPNTAQSTQPSSLFHTNIYLVSGYAYPIFPEDQQPQKGFKIPVIISAGVGWMNQEINTSKSLYDKGAFLYFGITVPIFGN